MGTSVREHIPNFYQLMKDIVSSLRSRFAEPPQMLPSQCGTGKLDKLSENPMLEVSDLLSVDTQSRKLPKCGMSLDSFFSPQFGRSEVLHLATLPRNLKKLQAELYGVSTLERGRGAAKIVPCGKDSIQILRFIVLLQAWLVSNADDYWRLKSKLDLVVWLGDFVVDFIHRYSTYFQVLGSSQTLIIHWWVERPFMSQSAFPKGADHLYLCQEEALLREGQLKDQQPKAGVCPNQWRSQAGFSLDHFFVHLCYVLRSKSLLKLGSFFYLFCVRKYSIDSVRRRLPSDVWIV